MKFRSLPLVRMVGAGVAVLVLVGIAVAMPLVRNWLKAAGEARSAENAARANPLKLVAPDTLAVPPDVVAALGVKTAEARKATEARPLPPLTGELGYDTDTLARARARFAGEVTELGTVSDPNVAPGLPSEVRPVRPGDKVARGQLLAVVWSKDLGEKKSELVDAVGKLRLDEEVLQRLQKASREGAIPERSLREAERNVDSDRIAVSRAERTLRAWRLTDAEIDEVKAEADRVRRDGGKRDQEQGDAWQRVEVLAPRDGTILEKNVNVGDIVDTSTDLFKLADLGRLKVWAHAYEEDLPVLQKLRAQGPIHWLIRPKNDPEAKPLKGTVAQIGDIIDPNQHTALVTGYVDNRPGELRIGQFVTATLSVPPPPDEVVVPTSALVEDGHESIVFVQPEKGKPWYALRRVAVARRYRDVVYLRSRLPGEPKAAEAGGNEHPVEPLRPGELVVVSGALVLRAALQDVQSESRAEK